jgi:hypothetical protein
VTNNLKNYAFWKALYHCLIANPPQEQALQVLIASPYDALQLSCSQYVVTLLYARLRQFSLLQEFPDDAVELMAKLYDGNLERNRAIDAQCQRVTRILNNDGITPLFIKGSAFLLDRVHPDPGMRIQADIDILTPPDQLDRVEAALLAAGYAVHGDIAHNDALYRQRHHHLPPLRHAEERASIELHHRLVRPDLVNVLPAEQFVSASRPIQDASGLRYSIPAPEWLLKHLFVHIYLQDYGYTWCKPWNLRALSDLHFLLARYPQAIDHAELDRDFSDSGNRSAWDCCKLEYRLFAVDEHPFGDCAPTRRARLALKTRGLRVRLGPRGNAALTLLFRSYRLPRRLATPSWYSQKYQELSSKWE